MGIQVLAVYRPRPGGQEALEAETTGHVPLLRRLGLATATPAVALRAGDGTIVETFEWVDRQAIERAHQHPEVLAMWARYEQCCTYGTLADLPNVSQPFAEFDLLGVF